MSCPQPVEARHFGGAMIVKRKWARSYHGLTWPVEGWFLFGLIPLYIRDLDYRPTIVGRLTG